MFEIKTRSGKIIDLASKIDEWRIDAEDLEFKCTEGKLIIEIDCEEIVLHKENRNKYTFSYNFFKER